MRVSVDVPPARQLALGFESLGHDCEFGLVQRRVGAEPLGLIRFTGHNLPDFRRALRDRFEGMTDDVGLCPSSAGEWITVAPRYALHFHTFQWQGSVDENDLLAREVRRLGFLRRKMLEDLTAGEKVFVRRSADVPPDADVEALWTDLCAYGPNTLLWVYPADDDHPHGTLNADNPRLLRGYLNTRPLDQNDFVFDTEGWMKLCRDVFRVRSGLPYGKAIEEDQMPAPPVRVVRAKVVHWEGDLELGSNGRMRHLQHNAAGDYYQQEDVLHVLWDAWPSELFIERGGVFRSVKSLGLVD